MPYEKSIALILMMVCSVYFFYIGYNSVFKPEKYEIYRSKFLEKIPFMRPFALYGKSARIVQIIAGFAAMIISAILFSLSISLLLASGLDK